MDNKRLIIVLISMIFVWSLFNILFPQNDNQNNQTVSEKINKPVIDKKEVFGVEKIKDFVSVKTDLYEIYFSKNKPVLSHIFLNNFKDKENNKVLLFSESVPFSFFNFSNGNLLYDLELSDNKITYLSNYNDLNLKLIYELDDSSYEIKSTVFIKNNADKDSVIDFKYLFNFPISDDKDNQFLFTGPSYYKNSEIVNIDVDDLIENPVQSSNIDWLSFQNKYFIAGFIPDTSYDSFGMVINSNSVQSSLSTDSFKLDPGSSIQLKNNFYLGPKQIDLLESVGSNFEQNIDYGFFSFIAIPVHHALNFIYSIVGNYGVAIIFITIIIKLLFWPLTNKSYASMKAMQALQPQMQKLREKYKNDKEKLNKAVMEMYKEHRVNPFGGCLPMIVQIPVFFALYKVLYTSIELRQAPFFLYITDLSVKDPYYITPLIMGATMFLQQKMSPTTLDPTQAKVMMAMPVVFTFMFLNFPSGLVLYWLVNNILTILQQYIINKKHTLMNA